MKTKKEFKIKAGLQRRIDKANNLIAKANEQDVLGIEPDSTWESAYKYSPIVTKGRFIYFQLSIVDQKGKIDKDRFNMANPEHYDDISYLLNHTIRALKKGFKADEREQIKEDLMNSNI